MRKTKIIATLGPSTDGDEILQKLLYNGANVFRLNMSHAPHDWVRGVVPRIRKAAAMQSRNVGILLDTQGPAIRTGDLPTKLNLKVGDIFTFTVRGFKSEEDYSIDTNYDDLVKDIQVGDVVLVDNGVIRMSVKEKNQHELRCEVLTPGEMGSRRHINLPGIKVNLPALTEKDLADIDVGLECGIDFIALSFVREAGDIKQLRELLRSKGQERVQIVAKFEDQMAVRNMDEIVEGADGVMVARGDLGIECPFEELPIIQRSLVAKCLEVGKPVIVATHLLESMISNPMPTRAEITDVANAVYERADAIMLSGETTTGKYPAECVGVMHKIAQRIETSGYVWTDVKVDINDKRREIIRSGVQLANEVRAHGICLFTRSGRMACLCAALRPYASPIFAFTPSVDVARQLSLRYGVYPIVMAFAESPDDTIRAAEGMLRAHSNAGPGCKIVIISDIVSLGETVVSVHLRTLH
jgi:pyruvate kinase